MLPPLPVLLTLALAAPLSARPAPWVGIHVSHRAQAAVGAQEARGDTVLWRGPLSRRPRLAGPPVPDTARVTLGLARVPVPFEIRLPRAPGLGSIWFRAPGEGVSDRVLARLAGADERLFARIPPVRRRAGEDLDRGAVAFLPELREAAAAPVPDETGAAPLPEFVSEFADLGIRLRGRGEFGGDWTRFRPCDTGVQFTCNPSLIPQLEPDLQFGLQVQGTVSERVVVNVDYDQTREFSAANNINIYYQGLEDEILQRLEVGDVTLSLPESRFLTEGIPAGNFGFRATGQLGPMDFQTVWAQQKGDLSSRDFTLAGAGGSQSFVQEDTLVIDDADYVKGQFFFITDPRGILDYPHVDILSLDPSSVPSSVLPGAQPIQLYRFENDPVTRQQVEGYIQADAIATLGADTLSESGWFRYLQAGVDYFVHPSGLWVALRSPLRSDEMLATTYITAAGDTVGTYNPERVHNAGGRPRLRLLKGSGSNHQPGRPTWDLEMHQVYRVSGSNDVDRSSVRLSLSLGELSAGRTFKRSPFTGEDVTLLALFGLDEESPVDQLDGAFVYKPALESFSDQPPVSGTFIVFPTLRPFQTPPAVPSRGLTAEQTAQILGADANPRIYENVDPFERDNGGLYRLTIPYRVRSEGVVSSFSLGALGIRDGSERIVLGERVLQPRTDYLIDYDLGQVTLLDAEGLFASSPGADLRATWEQKAVFQIAPTSVFGFNARYRFGQAGGLNFLGLYQSEKTLQRRPQLGAEPASIMLGGINGDLGFDVPAIDRALDLIPGLRYSGSSRVRLNGEVALSLPNPNTRDDVFLDDFDAVNDLVLSTLSPSWRLGSAPRFRDGAVDLLPGALNQTDAATLVWQHTWVTEGLAGDSVGVFEGFLPRQDIDRQINIAGNQIREPGLLLTFGEPEDTGGGFGGPRWRSMTTVLSATGLDLTKTEFLDFYAAGSDTLTLLIDIGNVDEDALFIDSAGAVVGTRSDGEPWGLGVLDQEANPRLGEIWSDQFDAVGNWDESCLARRAVIYRRGDPVANCTRGNGRRDSEDLDGDGNLDSDERYTRYVVRLGPSSVYLARDTTETGTLFRLFRIPLRGAQAINPAGLFTDADWRSVKHIRITVAGEREAAVVLARMRLVGSRWVKRSQDGVLRGIAGDTLAGGGVVEVSPVSVLSEGAAYEPPPGVLDELDDPTQAFGGQGIEFNEKSLGVRYRDIGPGERVEIYNRFPQRPRNLLAYRQARIWVVPREGDWGAMGATSFFVKVGSDTDNFYLYRARPEAAANPAAIQADDWLPELVVDFERWLDLRSEAEERLIENPPAPGDPPLVLWSPDSTYAVVLKDRARAPNLAQVRELSMGIWNQGDLVTSGEVWIDEFRLSRAFKDPGAASYVNLDVQAADFITTRVSVSDRGPFFRQLEADPTYQSDRQLSVNSTVQLSRFTPAGWGIDLPLTVQYSNAGQDPTFLSQSDIRADRLEGLRKYSSTRKRVGLAFRKRTPAGNPWVGWLVNGLDARVGYSSAASSTATSANDSRAFDARLGYDRQIERRDVQLIPDFLGGAVRFLLPGFLERRLLESRLRWSPERISMGTSYFNQRNEAFRFDQILRLPGDSLVVPTRSPREGLDSDARITFRPFEALRADLGFISSRDLLAPAAAVKDPSVQPLLEAERRSLAGVDLGWETNRSITTGITFDPRLAEWLRTGLNVNTTYNSNRNATFVQRTLVGADTVRELQRNVNAQRDVRANVTLEPGTLATSLTGGREARPTGLGGAARALGLAVSPVTVTWQDGVTSRFNREVIQPGTALQLGIGSLEDFRFIDGDTAATLVDRRAWTARSGLRLPLNVVVDANYALSEAATLDTRSDRNSLNETWPDVRVGVNDLPLPAFARALIVRANLGSGYRVDTRVSSFSAGGEQERVQEDRSVPFDLSIRWAGGLTTSYRGSLRRGDGRDPTGDTRREADTHGFSLTASFVPPGDLGQRLERPVQAALRFNYSAQLDCRITTGREDCVPFVDQLNRTLNLTLDTVVSQLEIGLQVSYTDRQSYVGQRTGSTQFQLGFWGQFLLNAGNFGARPPGVR